MKQIFFDMDGTIADLYNTKNWLESLMNEQEGLFLNLPVIHNKEELQTAINSLIEDGYNVGIITWTPKNVSKGYVNRVATEKRKWLEKHFPMITDIYCLEYGTPKQKANYKQSKIEILVDDNTDVIELWNTPKRRKSIVADKNLIENLNVLIQQKA